MSRIGKKPITIPKGVDVKLEGNNRITVKGPGGTLAKTLSTDMKIIIEDGVLKVERPSDSKTHKAMHGLTRSLISNMVEGVTKGFQKTLEINGVGYRAQKQGKNLILALGYSHPVEIQEPDDITFEVPAANKIIVKGIDKQRVGEYAAVIRSKRKPEVYKGKGIKYENETIKLKEGKAGA